MFTLSRRIKETAPMNFSVAELKRKYPDLINLSIGDTDFTTDPRIIRAAFRDAENGFTHYGDPQGDPELIDAVIEAWREDYGQNLDRRNVMITASSCLGMGLLILLFGAPLMSLYNSEAQVISDGLVRMGIIMPTYFLCGLMDVMVGQLRGIGYSIMPMIVSLTGACLLRIVWIMTVFAQNHTLTVLYMSYPVSWFVTFAIHFLCYMLVARKRLDQLKAVPAQD